MRRGLRAAARAWARFFHHPQPVEGLALFRILLGAVLLLDWALLAPDALVWLGERGVLSQATARRLLGGARLDVFAVLPAGDAWVLAVVAAAAAGATGLLLGYRTRWSAALAFVGLVSVHHRNPLILNSGDALLRALTFLLIWSPAGDALSLDRRRRRRAGAVEPPGPVLRPPWAQRLVQIQVAVVYLSTAWWKLHGVTWWDGTAGYYVLRLAEFQRFPLPLERLWIESLAVTRGLTWASLGLELAVGVLVWVPRLRYPVLAAAATLHLGLEYALNIPVFQWLMVASLAAFLPPRDVARACAWLAARAAAPGRGALAAGSR